MTAKSRNTLDGDIITLARGVAIYKTHASPYWNARVRDPATRKYVVRSTKETSRLKATLVAEELAGDLKSHKRDAPREFTFKHFATRFLDNGRTSSRTVSETPTTCVARGSPSTMTNGG
jgi:hypothetical protein